MNAHLLLCGSFAARDFPQVAFSPKAACLANFCTFLADEPHALLARSSRFGFFPPRGTHDKRAQWQAEEKVYQVWHAQILRA